MSCVMGPLGFGKGVERFSDMLSQATKGAFDSTSEQVFELGDGDLDQVQVRNAVPSIGPSITQGASGRSTRKVPMKVRVFQWP